MANRLKVQELRSELTKRGRSTTGIKPTLVHRLECNIRKEKEKLPDKNRGSVGKKRKRDLEDGGNLVGSNGSGKIKAADEFRKMGIKQLREQASLRGISTTGSKKELLERLSQNSEKRRKLLQLVPLRKGFFPTTRLGNVVAESVCSSPGQNSDLVKQSGECKLYKKLYESWTAYLTTYFNYLVTSTQIKHKKENMQKEWAFLNTLDDVTGLGINLESGEFDFSTEYRLELIKSNPKRARHINKDGYPSFKTLDSIFARSTASGLLVFGTASSHAPVAEHFSEDDNHTDTFAQKEHHIDNVVNDVRSRLNHLCSTSSIDICGNGLSSQSVGNGKRMVKEIDEGENWLKIMVQAIMDSKTKPNA